MTTISNHSNTIYTTFTEYTDDKQEQRKTVWIDDAGNLCKDSSLQYGGYTGIATKKRMKFSDLTDYIAEADASTLIMSSVFKNAGDDRRRLRTASQITDNREIFEGESLEVISRTKDHFQFADSELLGVIDIDFPSESKLGYRDEKVSIPYSCEELVDLLRSINQELQNVPFIVKNSSTGFLYVNGKEVSGPRYHVYFPIKKYDDFLYFRDDVFKRLFLAGYGWIQISSDGVCLERTFIDQSLYKNVTQPIFIHQAEITDSRIECKAPQIKYFEGSEYYERGEALSGDEERQYSLLVKDYKNKSESKRAAIEHKYCEDTLLKRGEDVTDERISAVKDEIHRKRDTKVLYNKDVIVTKKYGQVTVKEIWRDLEKYKDCLCLDPLDHTDGNEYKAKILVSGDVAWINSFAFGGRAFRFKHYENITQLTDEGHDSKKSEYLDVRSARSQLESAVFDFFIDKHQRKAITATPGFGKTYETLEAIVIMFSNAFSNPEEFSFYKHVKVDYFVSSHKLAGDVLKTWNQLVDKHLKPIELSEEERIEFYDGMTEEEITAHEKEAKERQEKLRKYLKAIWIKGRHYEDETNNNKMLCNHPKKKDLEKDQYNIIDGVYCRGGSGVNQGASFDNFTLGKCIHYDSCEYLQQWASEESKDAVIRFMAHDYLFLDMRDKRAEKVNFVIVDEDIIQQKMLGGGGSLYKYNDKIRVNTIDKVRLEIIDGVSVYDSIQIHRKELRRERKLFTKELGHCLKRCTKSSGAFESLGYHKEKRKLQRKIDIIRILLKYKKDHNNVWFDSDYKEGTLFIGEKKEISSRYKDKKFLFLDGTGSTEVMKKALGSDLEIVELKVKQSDFVKIVQDYRNNYSKSSLLKKQGIDEIVARIEKLKSERGKLGIICWKDAVDILKERIDWLDDADFMYFGNLRGMNTLKDKDHLVIISRYMINEDDLMKKARVLYADEDLDFSQCAQKKLFKMKNGQLKGNIKSNCFVDSKIQELQKHINGAEMIQAVGRARGIHCKSDKLIEIWTQEAIDIELDEIYEKSLENALDDTVSRLNVVAYEKDKDLSIESGMSIRQVRVWKEKPSVVFSVKDLQTHELRKDGRKGRKGVKKYLVKNEIEDQELDEALLKIGTNGRVRSSVSFRCMS